MTRIFNPPHPGETLREDVLPALGEENGGRADLRLAQQAACDRWRARAKGVPKATRAQART
ncbi:hypothetical protein C5O80_24290 [Burkholderia sp. SRS-46]|nr:hypothetical protein C5O80_24290 [Burkholderia sp. SRS-46]